MFAAKGDAHPGESEIIILDKESHKWTPLSHGHRAGFQIGRGHAHEAVMLILVWVIDS